MRVDDRGRRLCSATTRAGEPCKGPAITGGLVCRMHGGAAPQVQAAAERVTLAGLVNPALLRLRDLIEDPETPAAVVLGAIRTILEKTRYGEPLSEAVVMAEVENLIDEYEAELEPDERAAYREAQEAGHEATRRAMAEWRTRAE